jgi:hypothetical protein
MCRRQQSSYKLERDRGIPDGKATIAAVRGRSMNAITPNPSNDDVVILRGVSIPLASDVGGAFVADCSRNRERLVSDSQICEKYGLTFNAWAEIAQNKAVRLAVNAEHERRIRNGDAAKEAAAKLFAEAPEVLGKILHSEQASPRHRIEAARELRATANTGAESTGNTGERFIITINLGEDQKLVFDKPIAPLTPEEAKENLDAERNVPARG